MTYPPEPRGPDADRGSRLPAEAMVAVADSVDRLDAARAGARRRLLVAGAVTIVAPVNFVVQALIFWEGRWPSAGLLGLVLMVLFALTFWFRWWRSAAEVREKQDALDALTREPPQLPSGESESA